MDYKKFLKKATSVLPGPIIVWLQQWYNIFDTAEWSKTTGSFSVALGSVSILYFVTIWDELNKQKKFLYLRTSFIVFAISVALCLLLHFIVFVTLFSGPMMFQMIVWVWYITFIVFGISLAHFLTAVVLYKVAR
jgi:hypothetical protein